MSLHATRTSSPVTVSDLLFPKATTLFLSRCHPCHTFEDRTLYSLPPNCTEAVISKPKTNASVNPTKMRHHPNCIFHTLSQNRILRKLFAGRAIPLCNLLYKLRIRILHHDMKMLHRMYRFQLRPVLEPDDLPNRSVKPNQRLKTIIPNKLTKPNQTVITARKNV